MVSHYNYLFVTFAYSVFNEHLPSRFHGQPDINVLLMSFGRPKWTRTTDLVLIRHAL